MTTAAAQSLGGAFRRHGSLVGLAVLGQLLLTSTAMAQAWTGNGGDGNWMTPSNWSGGTLPTTAATNAAGQISLSTNAGTIGDFTIGGPGTVPELTISGSGELYLYSNLSLAQQVGDQANVTVTGPQAKLVSYGYLFLNSGGNLTIADGGYGYANIAYIGTNDGPANMIVQGTGSEFETFMLSVGAFGEGALTIADGGKVTSGYSTVIGEYLGAPGVITITGADSLLYATGSLIVGGASQGVLNLGSAQGEAAAEAGRIDVQDVFFGASDESGSLVFNHTGTGYDFSTVVATGPTASANTIMQLAGTTLLSADSTNFYGTTNVLGGSLRVNGKLGGIVNVAGGSLGGTGELLGDVNVTSGGTFAPGNSIGTVEVAGNVDFSTSSTLAVEVDADGNADRLIVGGTATIASGANVAVSAASGTYAPQTSYTILSASGGITGMFGVTTDHYFLTPTLNLAGNDLVLTMTQSTNPAVTVGSLAVTGNQGASGAAIDGLGAGNGVYDAFLPLNEADAKQLLATATGDAHAAGQQVIDQTFSQFNTAVGNRGHQAGTGTVDQPAPLGYVSQLQTAASAGIADAMDVTAMPMLAYWLAPVAAIGRNDDDGMGGAVNWATGGLTLGADQSFALENGTAYAGVALGYLRSQSKSSASTVTTDSGQIGVYGGMEMGALRLSGSLAYGLAQGDTSRTISGGAINLVATSAALTQSLGGTIELAYDVALTDSLTLTPMVGLDASISHRGASQESGAGAFNLSIDASTMGQLDPSLGIGIEQQFDTAAGQMTASAALAWQHSLLEAADQSLRFAGSNASFTLNGRSPEQDRLRLDLGLALAAGENMRVFGDYGGRFSAQSQDHSARLGIGGNF